jgi:O-succinylbenzoate synthase
MAELCRNAAIPVALDEELIGITGVQAQGDLLREINPRYIILKPGLLGGFSAAEQWIKLADDLSIGWWVTSALESNIGLSAIAQWTSSLEVSMPQGLGTGSLYSNNIPSPLEMDGDSLWYRPDHPWDLNEINPES